MSSSSFTYKSLMFALAVALLMPLAISVFHPVSVTLNTDETLQGYYDFTGSRPAQESVWVLTGIYTPYGTDAEGNLQLGTYGYTADGWLYGSSLDTYSPSQYRDEVQAYTVTKNVTEQYEENNETKERIVRVDNVFRYTEDTPYGNHKKGDLYSNVTMDVTKQSNIFFSEGLKVQKGDFFYYEYTGYRYAFQPTSDYKTISSNGDAVDVIKNTTSLSLVWYNYYSSTGISGQLIISGQDMSVAYLTASEIVGAFNSTTNTAKFNLTFSGISMNVYIKIDPTKLNAGMSIKDCYDKGYWSVMVTSKSADSSAYLESDYGLNPANLWQVMVDLFTFNTEAYGFTGAMGLLASFLFVAPFYAMLIAICVDKGWQMWVGVGILAAIQGIARIVTDVNVLDYLGGLF